MFGLIGGAAATLPLAVSAMGQEAVQPDPRPQPPPIKQPEPFDPIPAGWLENPHHRGPWTVLRANGRPVSFPALVYWMRHVDVPISEQADFASMSFRIERQGLTWEDVKERKTLQQWYETLDEVEIESPLDIERIRNKIAAISRRGRANTVEYYGRMPPIEKFQNFYAYPARLSSPKLDTGIIAYSGNTIYDRPFLGFILPETSPGEIFWVTHPDYKKYAMRYRIKRRLA
jgi:hypothetical protein